jgi:hypothetical protein
MGQGRLDHPGRNDREKLGLLDHVFSGTSFCIFFLSRLMQVQEISWALYYGRDFNGPRHNINGRKIPIPLVDSEMDKFPWYHGPANIPPQPNFLTLILFQSSALFVIATEIIDVVCVYVPILPPKSFDFSVATGYAPQCHRMSNNSTHRSSKSSWCFVLSQVMYSLLMKFAQCAALQLEKRASTPARHYSSQQVEIHSTTTCTTPCVLVVLHYTASALLQPSGAAWPRRGGRSCQGKMPLSASWTYSLNNDAVVHPRS